LHDGRQQRDSEAALDQGEDRVDLAGLRLRRLRDRCLRAAHRRLAGVIDVRTDFVFDALEQALYERKPGDDGGLIHHSDRGSQYVGIRYTERLAEAGIEPSVGSAGDAYDNALAETINGLYNAEVIHKRALEDHGERRISHAGMGRLAQPPPTAGADRQHPAD
jgi:transposase InsO family protein